MNKKTPVLLNICAVISLVIFGYLLFFTVYHQMISQNEGFFYVIVFGGILILAFILLSLMTKLLAFSRDSDDSVGFLILEIVFLLALSFVFVKTRVSYESTVPVEESVCHRAAELLHKGTLSIGGGDIMPQLMRKPAYFFMSAIISAVFSFSGTVTSVTIYVNTVLLLAVAFLSYGIVRRISSRICSLFVFALSLFMPSNAFAVYNYDAQLLFAFILLLAVFFSVIPMTRKRTPVSIVFSVFAGFFWGITLCMEPVSILLLLSVLLLGRIGYLSYQISGLIIVVAIMVFFGMLFLMSATMEVPMVDLLGSFAQRFNPFMTESGNALSFHDMFANFNDKIDAQQKSIADNYYFLFKADGSSYSSVQIAWMQLGSQILYMFLLILSIACAFYMIRSGNPRILPILTALIAGFFMIFLSSANEYNSQFYLLLILMTAGVSLQYMYENHHALADENLHKMLGDEEEEDVVKEPEETEEEKAAFLARAQALIFVGMNEEYYKQIKLSESRQVKAAIEERASHVLHPKENADKPAAETEKVIPPQDKVEKKEEKAEEKKKEIKYLENPLPVPKKHKPKDLDFDRVSVQADGDTDFDLSDVNDDFDFPDDFDI